MAIVDIPSQELIDQLLELETDLAAKSDMWSRDDAELGERLALAADAVSAARHRCETLDKESDDV